MVREAARALDDAIVQMSKAKPKARRSSSSSSSSSSTTAAGERPAGTLQGAGYGDGKVANRDTKVWHGATEKGP
jgi:hypothetical protein